MLGKAVICTCEGTNTEGKDVTIRNENIVDGDTLTFRVTNVVVGGEEQPDEEFKYRRVK